MPQLNRPNKVLSLITGQAVPGNAGVALMARIRGNSHALVTQASVTSITYSVWDVQAYLDSNGETDATAVVTTTSMTVSAVVFDALQQSDGLWTKDGPGRLGPDLAWGYNFKFVVPAVSFTVARSGHRHRVDVLVTPVSGEQFRLPFEFDTVKVFA